MLGSGSRGNAILLEADGARVLVDAGFSIRDLVRRLKSIGVTPTSIEAVIITHEHTDHVRAAAAGARAFGWRIYASPRTVRADISLQSVGTTAVDAGTTVALSTMDLAMVPVPHDAAQPVAVVATARLSGARTGVVYDLGHVTRTVQRGLAALDVLILEANHDLGMLRAGPYPPCVIDRIAGAVGHLSNGAAADLACAVAHPAMSRVVLAHISANCNLPHLAVRTVAGALARARRGAVSVSTAAQDAVTGPFTPRGGVGGSAAGVQLSLGF